MKVVSIKDQKDGSAIITLDMNREEYDSLMRQGIQLILEGKAKVLSMAEAKAMGIKGGKKYEISDADADECVRTAVLAALRKKMKECKKGKK